MGAWDAGHAACALGRLVIWNCSRLAFPAEGGTALEECEARLLHVLLSAEDGTTAAEAISLGSVTGR